MSYYNHLLCTPIVSMYYQLNNKIMIKYLHQHTAIVDMTLYDEIKYNRQSIDTTPFYPTYDEEERTYAM